MGCLNANITMLNTPPTLSIDRVGGITAMVSLASNPLMINLYDATSHLKAELCDITSHLKVKCSVVCSIKELPYLNVSPEEVQWITSDYGVVYHVESNTNWMVTTSLI